MPSKLLRAPIKALKVTSPCDDHVTRLAGEFKVSEQGMTIGLSPLV
jgi:hypothetical protein